MKNQQKLPKQRLRLSKETIHELQRSELAQVAGGSVTAQGTCNGPTAEKCNF